MAVEKQEYDVEKTHSEKEKVDETVVLTEEAENSRIEAVALGMS